MKQFLVVTCLMVSLFFSQKVFGQKQRRCISEEINNILENDADVKYRWNMKNDDLKGFLYATDVAHIVARDNSWIGSILDKIFYNFLSGSLLRQQLKDLIFLSEEKAPRINAMVKSLASKSGISQPPIFLAGDKELFNALATSFSHGRSMVVVSKKFVDAMTDEEIKGVFAHELGHVKHNHIPKKLMTGLTLLGVQMFVVYKILQVIHQREGLGTFENDSDRYVIKESMLSKSILSRLPVRKVSKQEVMLKSLLSYVVLIGSGIATGWLMSWFSRCDEYQADDESIRIAGPQAFLAAMEAIKSYTQEELEKFELEYEFCKKQVSKLKKMLPEVAGVINDDLERYHELVIEAFDKHLEEHSGSHPALNDRIARGKEALDLEK